jgi:flavin-dependent thymidylate synthase
MKVTLLTTTERALDLLIFTKNTRLKMAGTTLDEISQWPVEQKLAELAYMKNTIQSSWEFVDFTFAIEGVTRAFTHQLVRHRVGTSFAQQAQRVVDMKGFEYLATGKASDIDPYSMPKTSGVFRDWGTIEGDDPADVYEWTMDAINMGYEELQRCGVKPQDARGVLPTNVLTNIVFKANLRTLHDMALKRLCVKAQGEFQDVFKEIVREVGAKFPWAEQFLRVQCAWTGTCLFPSLPVEECHVKAYVYDPANAVSYGRSMGKRGEDSPLFTTEQIYQLHRAGRSEPQPVVRL